MLILAEVHWAPHCWLQPRSEAGTVATPSHRCNVRSQPPERAPGTLEICAKTPSDRRCGAGAFWLSLRKMFRGFQSGIRDVQRHRLVLCFELALPNLESEGT